MLRSIILSSFFIIYTLSVSSQTILSDQSTVTFKIGNMGLSSVDGTFSGMKGEVTFSPSDFSQAKFNVCVDASSIDTGNEKRDNHLKNEDFFEVETYPTICFVSDRIEQTEAGFNAIGTLNMHGQSQTVEIPFTYTDQTFTGSLTVKRRDYDIGPKGGFMVGKEVNIQIICKVQ